MNVFNFVVRSAMQKFDIPADASVLHPQAGPIVSNGVQLGALGQQQSAAGALLQGGQGAVLKGTGSAGAHEGLVGAVPEEEAGDAARAKLIQELENSEIAKDIDARQSQDQEDHENMLNAQAHFAKKLIKPANEKEDQAA